MRPLKKKNGDRYTAHDNMVAPVTYIAPPLLSYASCRTKSYTPPPAQPPLLHPPPPPPPPLGSPVIGMKGNGPERGRKETFLHSYLLTPTVSGANSRTHSEASLCMYAHTHTHTQAVYLLQDDGRNNISLIVKHIKGKTHRA